MNEKKKDEILETDYFNDLNKIKETINRIKIKLWFMSIVK